MVIDAHAHIIVPEITRQKGESGWQPYVYWEDGRQVIEFAGKQIRSALREFVHIELLLQALHESGVDGVLICPWVSLLRYDAPPLDGLRDCRTQNDALGVLAQDQSQRIFALGAVPLQDPELAARELELVMQTPGLYGVEVAASVQGTYLGDDRFRSFWAAAEELGALVFIHPTTRGFSAPVFNEYYLWNAVGNPLETSITAAHLVLAGVMESHPRLKVLLAHAGGALLALRGRLRHAHSFQDQARSRLNEPLEASLKRFYFDSLTHDPDLLRALIDYAGPEHVLLGSDYPFDMGDARPADTIRALSLQAAEENLILGANAARLLDLPA